MYYFYAITYKRTTNMDTWITAKLIKINKWNDNLFSLILHAPILPFTAGQFTKLSYEINNKKKIQRAYSFVNAPNNKNLEFYITLIKEGKLTPYLFNLTKLNQIKITKRSFGFFTLQEIPNCENLWMLATGTGIGPYLSILQCGKHVERFNKIILIHAVRYSNELIYLPLLNSLKQKYKGKLYTQFIISRESTNFSLEGRIPQLILNGTLEKKVQIYISHTTSHIMLCGNPNMVRETRKILIETKHMKKNLRSNPGHITSENYW